MANYTFTALKSEYVHKWAHMEINNDRLSAANQQADRIIAGKERYIALEAKTGVPWYVIGLIHLRESNCDFSTHLHNGDPLIARTYHVPKGWPKTGKAPFTFEESAVDALTMPGKELHKIKDWSIERIAYTFEQFNGFGYRARGKSSAYLWASSNQYSGGKFIFDGPKGWRPDVYDTQLGAMVVLKCVLDKTSTTPATDTMIVITDDTPNTPTAGIPRPTTKELNQVSQKFWYTDLVRWLGFGGASVTGAYQAASSLDLETTRDAVQNIGAIGSAVGAFGILAIFLAVVVFAIYMQKRMKDDVQEGRATPSGESNDTT